MKARNEAEAVEACAEHPFDLAIVDYLIPPKTGVEILAAVRKKLPLIKSILVSARLDKNASEDQIKDVVRGKVEVDALDKPVRPEDLARTVTKLLQASSDVDWKKVAEKSRTAQDISDQDTTDVITKLRPYVK